MRHMNLPFPQPSAQSLTVAGLFAGIGGIELGLHKAGHQTKLLCELDPPAARVLKHHFKKVRFVKDIREFTTDDKKKRKRFPKVNVGFTHNMKRNDEELRVEATGHHLRQPYAVMAAVVFLPFESCTDKKTSSFGSWVSYLWRLKGRDEPTDPPDIFELVFIGLYARDGTELGFFEVGGEEECPRHGRPPKLLTLKQFLMRLEETYEKRNSEDFFFAGERPAR